MTFNMHTDRPKLDAPEFHKGIRKQSKAMNLANNINYLIFSFIYISNIWKIFSLHLKCK